MALLNSRFVALFMMRRFRYREALGVAPATVGGAP